MEAVGGKDAEFANINIPLHPGSGKGAYSYAFERVVMPALDKFKPDLILVSSGYDASFADPLGAMILTSESYREFTSLLMSAADKHAGGKIIFTHEGGYSKDYVPYCGLAVVETLRDHRTVVTDPYLEEAEVWGYQHLLPHQAAVVDAIAALHKLSPPPKRKRSDSDSGSHEEGEIHHHDAVAKAMRCLLDTVAPGDRATVLEKLGALEKANKVPAL
jgi:hypothetical protein